jgi:ankyrin repeat protein
MKTLKTVMFLLIVAGSTASLVCQEKKKHHKRKRTNISGSNEPATTVSGRRENRRGKGRGRGRHVNQQTYQQTLANQQAAQVAQVVGTSTVAGVGATSTLSAQQLSQFSTATPDQLAHELCQAIRQQNTSVISQILALPNVSSFINLTDRKGYTPLGLADAVDNSTIIQQLQQEGATNQGTTVPQQSSQGNWQQQGNQGNWQQQQGQYAQQPSTSETLQQLQSGLCQAIASNNEEAVQQYLALSNVASFINLPDANGNTPLGYANANANEFGQTILQLVVAEGATNAGNTVVPQQGNQQQ